MLEPRLDSVSDRWIDERELSHILGLKPSTFQKWRLRGSGPRFSRFGKAIRYRLRDALAWAELMDSVEHLRRELVLLEEDPNGEYRGIPSSVAHEFDFGRRAGILSALTRLGNEMPAGYHGRRRPKAASPSKTP